MIDRDINEVIENKINLVNAYTKKKSEDIKNSILQIDNKYKNFQADMEESLLNSKETNEYSDYVKYIVSEDFENKQKAFIEEVEKTIIRSLPKKNNNLFYVYIVIGVLFALQIVMFIAK